MDREPGTKQWPVFNAQSSADYNPIGCLYDRLGASCLNFCRRPVVFEGETVSNKPTSSHEPFVNNNPPSGTAAREISSIGYQEDFQYVCNAGISGYRLNDMSILEIKRSL